MDSQKSIRAQKIRSRILRRLNTPNISWYLQEDKNFLSSMRTIVIYIPGNDGKWVFVQEGTSVIPGFNRALSLIVTHLGDTILVKYDRSDVLYSPDYLTIQYRIEHRGSGKQTSGLVKAWGIIRRVLTTVFTKT